MPFTLTMPKLSPTMEEGTIVKWKKKVGDFIKADDVVFEVATDKATVEYTALDDGFLRTVLIPEGKEARVNQAVAVLSAKKDEDISSYKPEGLAEVQKPVAVAASVASAEPVQEKKMAPAAPVAAQPSFIPEPPLTEFEFPFPIGPGSSHIKASPYAKKLAQEKGIDLSTVKGSGPHQRILARDISLGQSGSMAFGSREMPDFPPGAYEEESLSPMRKVIAQRLQQSKSWIPHFYVTQEMNAEGLMAIRQQLKEGGVKITVNDLVIRAAALALREHPEVNSGFNSVTSSIIRFKTVDISVAVSVDAGLITPIVRHADYKNLGQISVEIRALAEKAKANKLQREEYIGGSFTISNLGMFGISEFKGIINPPQAAILCVSGVQEKPVVKDGKVVPGKTMAFTLAADHRVIDGADSAKFLKTLQRFIENPALLLV